VWHRLYHSEWSLFLCVQVHLQERSAKVFFRTRNAIAHLHCQRIFHKMNHLALITNLSTQSGCRAKETFGRFDVAAHSMSLPNASPPVHLLTQSTSAPGRSACPIDLPAPSISRPDQGLAASRSTLSECPRSVKFLVQSRSLADQTVRSRRLPVRSSRAPDEARRFTSLSLRSSNMFKCVKCFLEGREAENQNCRMLSLATKAGYVRILISAQLGFLKEWNDQQEHIGR
jgi:hypothetical protein